MRTAIISDIHGNLTAFDAVLADLRETSPDLVLHGGDLADAGSSPEEIVDRICALGWLGVAGNTDEMLFRPESLEEFAKHSSAPAPIWKAVSEIAAATRARLGDNRMAWLRKLPHILYAERIALLHASPENLWLAPAHDATNTELKSAYGRLERPVVVYGHIHHPYFRTLQEGENQHFVIINSGSVGLSYDGDPRASYILVDDLNVRIRRVEYDMEAEIRLRSSSGLPRAEWISRMLRSASPQIP